MLGHCPLCGAKIFKMKGSDLIYPLGNYRSIILLKDTAETEFPLCDNCHDMFDNLSLEKMGEVLTNYTGDQSFKDKTYDSFIKRGPLRSEDKEGMRIWV